MAISLPLIHDNEILSRIRTGEEAAFETLFREHYAGLCVFATRILESRAVAEEIVQDVFLRLWERRNEWETTGSVSAYLYAAVRNRAFNRVRQDRAQQRWQERVIREHSAEPRGAESSAADEHVRSDELAAAIERGIAELPPRCREAFVLRRQHHLSYAEIARVMNIAPKTVEIQIGLALKSLRGKLAEWL